MSRALILFGLLFFVSTVVSVIDQAAYLETAVEKVDGEYIVVFKSMDDDTFASAVSSLSGYLSTSSALLNTHQIGNDFQSAHLKLTPEDLAKVRAQNFVKYVSENGIVHKSQAPACTQQNDVIWNLDRIDTHDINLVNDVYRYGYAGEGVDAYIIDTGVLTTHVEFESRASWGANFAGDGVDQDCNGHGTHVAGTVGGVLYGVAKKANLIAVKVLNCGGSGTYEGVIAGIEYTAQQAKSRGKPSVGNMSLGGGLSAAVNEAVAAAVKSGVTMAVAAGNSNYDACQFSPASEPLALTVAATTIVANTNGDEVDMRSSFSNFGSCVDVAAPGQLVKAAWIDQSGIPPNTATNTISGTSMASPHVAGVVAVILSENPTWTPAQVEQYLKNASTDGVIDLGCSGNAVCELTPNKLLFTHCDTTQ